MKRCRHKWSQEVALIGTARFSCDRCGRTKTVSAVMPTTYGPPLPEWRARHPDAAVAVAEALEDE